MILIAETVILLVLITALVTIIIEESKIKRSKIPRGTVKEYWSGPERRQSIRINTSLIVRYGMAKEDHNRLNGRTKDVSSNGMRLLINEKLTKGTLLLLEFDLPDTKDAINAEGKVIWADGEFGERDKSGRRIFHTGIQFIDIKPDAKNRLTAYIKRIAKKD